MSGRLLTDEYKRTIGALFAVYWLMRLDLPGPQTVLPPSRSESKLDGQLGGTGLDGQLGFTFGVDEHWRPPTANMIESGGKYMGSQRNVQIAKYKLI